MSTITSANAKFIVTLRNSAGVPIAPPFNVQGFASDDAFATDAVDTAEAQMGVDGKMSAGYLPHMIPQVITLQSDSESISFFENWEGLQKVLKDLLFAEAVLELPSVGTSYACNKGALTRQSPMRTGKKVLQPMTYQITWETVVPVPVAA